MEGLGKQTIMVLGAPSGYNMAQAVSNMNSVGGVDARGNFVFIAGVRRFFISPPSSNHLA